MKTQAIRIILAVLLLLDSFGSSAWAATYSIGYQGQLRQSGVPATGTHSVVFKIYPTETGGTPIWTSPTETVSFVNGQFFSTFTPTGVDWEGTSPVLEVSIDGTALTPREALSAIPYAFNAQLHSGKKYTTAAAAPAAAAAGDLWYDSAGGAFKYFNGTAWVAPTTGGGSSAVFSQSAQFSGDGSSGNPLTLLASSVTLQGNTVNLPSSLVRLDSSGRYPALDGSLITNLPSSADRLAKAGDTMTGDLQVGGAAASTFSISGFITLANLGGAPGAARGRLYFDPTGAGAFKVSLDGASFVSLATGTVAGADDSRVLKTGDTMTGQLTNTSTITIQGNSFSVGGSTLVVTGGNVGIGTTNPQAKLDVNGSLKIGTGSQIEFGDSTVKLRTNTTSFGQRILILGGDEANPTAQREIATPGALLIEANTGNNGEGRWYPAIQMNANGSANFKNPSDGSGQGIAADRILTLDFTSGVRVPNGNVGIGAASPSSRLHVSGGDLQVGDATASTVSASGYLTLANLGSAPAAAPGRLYYDTTGDGSLKVRLNSGSFISLATGTVSGVDDSRVLKAGDTMTGQLTLSGSSATITGQDASGYSLKLSSGLSMPAGTVTAGLFVGNGAGLSNISASNVAAANVLAGALGPNVIASSIAVNSVLDGSIVTVSASKLTGTVPTAALGSAVLKAGDTMTGQLTLSGSTATITGQDASGYSLKLSSGLSMPAGTVTAGLFVGNGAGLTGITGTDASRVLKAGDTMTGALTMSGSEANIISGSSITTSGGLFGAGVSIPYNYKGVNFASGQSIIDNGNNNLRFTSSSGGTAPSFQFTATGPNPIAHFNTPGGVGIGISIPAYMLHTVGDAFVTGQQIAGGTMTVQGNAFSVGSSTFVVANGNVGIGTVSSIDKLTIERNVADSTGGLTLKNAHTGGDGSAITYWGGSQGGFNTSRIQGAENGTGGQLILQTADASKVLQSRMWVKTDGNVGIGTGSPSTRLDVKSAGATATDYTQIWRDSSDVIKASMSATGVLYADGSGLRNLAAADNTKVAKTGDTMTGQLTNTSTITVQGNAFSVGGSTLVVADGNVGIGTASPNNRLQVANLINFNDSLTTTGIGSNAGRVNTGSANVFLGYRSGYNNTSGSQNVFLGDFAGNNNTADSDNTFVGHNAGYSNAAGNSNSFIGSLAGSSNNGGSNNSYLGYAAGRLNVSASNNVSLGYAAGYNNTAAGNTFVGSLAGYNTTSGGSNIVIGYNQNTPTATTSNFLNIGGAIYGNLSSANIGLGTTSPSSRLHVSGGDLQVGDATASTVSASGYLTFANLGSAPAAAPGRLYYDTTGDGSLKVRLNSGSFVSLATGTIGSGSFLSKDGDTMTGQLTNTSTITIQGNAFSVGSSTFVVANGNVGIGTTSPSTLFQVGGGTLAVTTAGNVGIGTTGPKAKLHLTGGEGDTYSKAVMAIGYADSSNYSHFIHTRHQGGTAAGNAIDFYTNDGTQNGVFPTNAVQGLTISNSNVGIGTVSPGTRLDIKSAGATATDYSQIWRDSSDVIKASMSATGVLYAEGSGLRNVSATDSSKVAKGGDTMTGQLTNTSTITIQGNAFSVGGSTFVVANGNVGIGTTNPDANSRLEIVGANQVGLSLNGGAGAARTYMFSQGTGGSVWGISGPAGVIGNNAVGIPFIIATNSSPRVTVLDNGNVGIGTVSPGTRLHVVDTTLPARFAYDADRYLDLVGNVGVTLRSTDIQGNPLVLSQMGGNGTTQGGILFNTGPNGSNTEKMRIDPVGNLGIGTTSPAAKLDVAGQMYARVYNAGAGTSIDWNNGNVQYTSAAPGAITLSNMQDGGAYTLVCTNATSGTFTLSHTGLTFRFAPANGATTASSRTVYTMLRVGSEVLVSWISGF